MHAAIAVWLATMQFKITIGECAGLCLSVGLGVTGGGAALVLCIVFCALKCSSSGGTNIQRTSSITTYDT
jgi:hypothetical protein